MTTPEAPAEARRERRFYATVGALTLLLASLPYLWGYAITPADQVFTGLTYNIDDHAVYFSWMRQAENGHFFLRNQFAVEPQRGVLFNLFFWCLGSLARITHLPLIAVYHGARIVTGGLLLWAVTGLIRATLTDARARRTAFGLVCVGAGFGWLWSGGAPEGGPVDLWQPEAITFLSLYFTPLFTAALALMVLFFTAMLRAERTGRLRDAGPAALAGALLGNFHSYDVIHLFAVWGAFQIVRDSAARRVNAGGWARLIVVGLATLPTTAYQYWALQVEPTFYERAFVSSTWSTSLIWVLLGYGVTTLLALAALLHLLLRKRDDDFAAQFRDGEALRFLLCWGIVGIAVAYVPVAFQRKLLMGAHLPLCLLSGALAAYWARRLPARTAAIALTGLVLLAAPTNLWFLRRDMNRVVENVGSTSHRPRLTRDEWDALQWLRRNTRPADAVLAGPDPTSHLRFPHVALYPFLSVYVPAFAGNVVFDGHWSETPRFGRKVAETTAFFRRGTPDAFRRRLLRDNHIRYVLQANALADLHLTLQGPNGPQEYVAVPWPHALPPYLRPVYANPEVSIYEVISP